MQIYDGRGRGGGRAVELALFFFYDGDGHIAQSHPPLVKEIAERRPNYTGRSRGVSAALEDGWGGAKQSIWQLYTNTEVANGTDAEGELINGEQMHRNAPGKKLSEDNGCHWRFLSS